MGAQGHQELEILGRKEGTTGTVPPLPPPLKCLCPLQAPEVGAAFTESQGWAQGCLLCLLCNQFLSILDFF